MKDKIRKLTPTETSRGSFSITRYDLKARAKREKKWVVTEEDGYCDDGNNAHQKVYRKLNSIIEELGDLAPHVISAKHIGVPPYA